MSALFQVRMRGQAEKEGHISKIKFRGIFLKLFEGLIVKKKINITVDYSLKILTQNLSPTFSATLLP